MKSPNSTTSNLLLSGKGKSVLISRPPGNYVPAIDGITTQSGANAWFVESIDALDENLGTAGGATGATGPQGPTGATGVTGPRGNSGPAGSCWFYWSYWSERTTEAPLV